LYNFFKDHPARRGLFIHYTNSIEFPFKFYSVRWLQNNEVAQRAIKMLPNLKKIVSTCIKSKEATMKYNSFLTTQKYLKDPLLEPKLAFFMTLASDN